MNAILTPHVPANNKTERFVTFMAEHYPEVLKQYMFSSGTIDLVSFHRDMLQKTNCVEYVYLNYVTAHRKDWASLHDVIEWIMNNPEQYELTLL
jgi:hypothetical protein